MHYSKICRAPRQITLGADQSIKQKMRGIRKLTKIIEGISLKKRKERLQVVQSYPVSHLDLDQSRYHLIQINLGTILKTSYPREEVLTTETEINLHVVASIQNRSREILSQIKTNKKTRLFTPGEQKLLILSAMIQVSTNIIYHNFLTTYTHHSTLPKPNLFCDTL